jgi:hypothetical protein
MNNIEQAIKEAVETGGYTFGYVREFWIPKNFSVGTHDKFELRGIFLDPLFWQALGKARGWSVRCPLRKDNEYMSCKSYRLVCWQCKWHTFVDHLAEGKDAESFFGMLDSK